MQAIVKASRKPVASLNDGEGTTDGLWETTVPVMISCIHIDLQEQKVLSMPCFRNSWASACLQNVRDLQFRKQHQRLIFRLLQATVQHMSETQPFCAHREQISDHLLTLGPGDKKPLLTGEHP